MTEREFDVVVMMIGSFALGWAVHGWLGVV